MPHVAAIIGNQQFVSINAIGSFRARLEQPRIMNAIQRLYKLRKRPKPQRILKMGEAWKPYRSVASWYLWQTLRNEPLAKAADSRRPSQSTSRAR